MHQAEGHQVGRVVGPEEGEELVLEVPVGSGRRVEQGPPGAGGEPAEHVVRVGGGALHLAGGGEGGEGGRGRGAWEGGVGGSGGWMERERFKDKKAKKSGSRFQS